MRIPTYMFGIFLGFIITGSFSCAASDIYDTILQRVHKEQMGQVQNIKRLDSMVTNDLINLDTINGEWRDVDYSDHKRIHPDWKPVLGRMRRMTVAYTAPKSKFYEDKHLWRLINRSLRYFSNYKPLPYCNNWYMQGIARPRTLALSLINMHFGKEQLDSTVWQSTINALCRDTAVYSPGRNNPMHRYNYGANKADIANDWIYIAALLRNKYMLEVGAREVFAPIAFSKGEGIQYDLSYDMHYGYLYNGAYGTVFMSSVIKAATYLRDTPYALKNKKLALFRKFIITSIFDVMRGSFIDWNVIGRGISGRNATKRNFNKSLKILKRIDPEGSYEYEVIYKRLNGQKPPSYGVKSSHRVFWTNDYTVHIRPSYFFSVHAVSNRNHSQEIGNKENLKGYWGAEGTTDLMMSGEEYNNIFPLWNWTKLPGTTLPDTLPIPKNKPPGEGDRYGTSAFSGGVSDSLYGVTAYVMNEDLNTSARKSWFMFDHEIVCLGTGISSSLPYEISTTLNQCIYDDEGVYIGQNGKVNHILFNTAIFYKNGLDWVIHGGVAYLFPDKGTVRISVEDRKGDWSAVRGGQKHYDSVEKKIFQLTIESGKKPINASYAYILIPDIYTPQEVKEYSTEKNIIIKENNKKLQAVYHEKLKIWQMVFYEKDVKYSDNKISVWTDIPSAVMIKKLPHKDSYKLSVADPSQQYKEIKVHIKIKTEQKIKTYTLQLPKKPYAGRSTSIMVR